jgi:hypothetical protein
MSVLDKMWEALESYQEQADADGHGESWRAACEVRTTAALDVAGEDAGKKMHEADPTWELRSNRKWNDDYERLYVAGEALYSAAFALSAKTDAERHKHAGAATRLVARAQGIDEEDEE